MSEVTYKTSEEIELIKKSSLLVSAALAEVAKVISPGITTLDLDKVADDFITKNGGYPVFKGYQVYDQAYPFATCISVNEAVVHGLPNDYVIQDGDIISVDIGVKMNDFIGDSAYTFAVGNVKEEVLNLLRVTKQSLYLGIDQAKVNNRVGDIGFAVQSHCEGHGYSVVTELVGHGVGRELHEDPQIPNYGRRGAGKKLQEGLVIAIEPMINLGKKELGVAEDGWTYITKDGKASAHYEHTIALTKSGPVILSDFSIVEQAELSNKNLNTSYFA